MFEKGAFYDDLWGHCGDLDEVSVAAHHRSRLVEERVARLLDEGGGRVLDVGCGPGRLLERLAQRLPRAELNGCDVSERSLEMARRQGAASELFHLDLSSVSFDAEAHRNSYDVVTCCEVIEHLSDDLQAVQRLRELVSSGGHIVLTAPGGGKSRFDERIGHRRHYTRRTLGTLLVNAGLDPVEVVEWGFPFHNAYRSAVRTASRWTLSESTKTPPKLPRLLGELYSLTSHALNPLYYLNAPFWGEQLIATARVSSEHRLR